MSKLNVKALSVGIAICIALYIGVFWGRVSSGNMVHVSDVSSEASYTQAQDVDRKYTLNLNTATKELLLELPGMTPSLADEIIAYRETYGDFIAVRELLELDSMTESIYKQIKTLVYVS